MQSGPGRILFVVAACMGAAIAAPRSTAAADADAWGAFEGLAGACWAGPRELSCFEWDLPGETLVQTTLGSNNEQVVTYRLDASGSGGSGDDGSRLHAPRADVTIRDLAQSKEPMRVVYRLQGDRLDISIERQAAGAWMSARTEQRTRATPAQVADAQASAQAFRDEQRRHWGVLADLAGKRFGMPGTAGYLFSWVDPGRVLRFVALQEGVTGDSVREITYDAGSGSFLLDTKVRVFDGTWYSTGDPEQAFILADGGFYIVRPRASGVRIALDESGSLTIQNGNASKSAGTFQADGVLERFGPASRQQYALVEQRNHAAAEQIHQRALAAQRARAAEEARSGDSGLMGALVGAAVGAYAGTSAGLDTAQTLDLMVQGAAMSSGSNPVAEGFARGWAEETAKQDAMRQELEAAAYRGLAQGSAEYARREAERVRQEAEWSDADDQQAAGHVGMQASAGAAYGAAGGTQAGRSTPRYTALPGAGTGSWATAGEGSSGGQASTRNDSATCVSPPVTSTHRCSSLSGYKAQVSNNCTAPVDIRVCFMTADGWNCQASYGVAPGGDWEPGWCHANTGQVFHASRYSDSNEPLDSP